MADSILMKVRNTVFNKRIPKQLKINLDWIRHLILVNQGEGDIFTSIAGPDSVGSGLLGVARIWIRRGREGLIFFPANLYHAFSVLLLT